MINIHIEDEFMGKLNEEKIKKAIIGTFAHQKITVPYALSLVVTSSKQIQELNKTYRQQDKPTDVLSFSSEEIDPETNSRYWGDVMIAFPIAEKQAIEADHSVMEEILLLTVHGCLHLLGHDHYDDSDKTRMWQAQNEILDSLGVDARPLY